MTVILELEPDSVELDATGNVIASGVLNFGEELRAEIAHIEAAIRQATEPQSEWQQMIQDSLEW